MGKWFSGKKKTQIIYMWYLQLYKRKVHKKD